MMKELCEVCGGEYSTIQRRDEIKERMERVVLFKTCQGCGAGRVDYHPFMPVRDYGGEDGDGPANS